MSKYRGSENPGQTIINISTNKPQKVLKEKMFLLYFHNFSAENMTFKLTLHVHTPENPEIQDHKADMAIYYLSCSPKILCTCMHNNPFFSMGEGEHPSLRVLLLDLEGKKAEY